MGAVESAHIRPGLGGFDMIFVMSDIHGYYDEFMERIHQLNDLKSVKEGIDRLILLGDYIDRGPDSFKVLQKIYDIQQKCGTEHVIVLRGNHEEWFLDFIEKGNKDWLVEDTKLNTSKTFITFEQVEELKRVALESKGKNVYDYVRQCIRENHQELLSWLKNLPYYYATDTQIFVHAGVDEEAGGWWNVGTPDYFFVSKYPATTGEFYMDIIAGHTSTASIIGERDFCDVLYDGWSHYYIDGGVDFSGKIPVLAYDEKIKKYYSLQYPNENGTNDIRYNLKDLNKKDR